LLCWTVVSLSSPKTSAAEALHVAVKIDGTGGDEISAQIVAALPEGFEAIDSAAVAEELSRRKLDDMAAALGDASRRPVLIKKIHRVERALKADALIAGSVVAGERKNSLELQLVIVLVEQEDAAFDETLVLNNKGLIPARRLKRLLEIALEPLRQAASAEKEGAAAPAGGDQSIAETAQSQGEVGPVTPTDARVVVGAGFDLGSRQLHYNERITNANLRPYDLPNGPLLPVAPGGTLSIELYPFARSPQAGARDIGVTSHLAYNYAKAEVGNVTLGTSWYAWDVNLRGRYNLGSRGSSPLVGLEAGLGQLVFSFKDSNAGLVDTLAGVSYLFLRVGADGRIPVGKVGLIAGAAYRHLLKTQGSLGAHFPRADIAGLDARVGAALPLTGNIEARLMVTYIRYWAEFNSKPGDTYIAGGAVDNMLSADLGIAVFF
jgi:hypothetical protein